MICLLCSTPFTTRTWNQLVFGKGDVICRECREKFIPTNGNSERSYFYQTPFENALDSLTCMFIYDEWMKQYFHRYKKLGDYALHQVFSGHFRHFYPCVPVPIFNGSENDKTFSPVEALLVPQHIVHLLEKTTPIKQSQRTLYQRLHSSNPFSWTGTEKIPSRIVLVDDIYTTGMTLHQAALLLKENGVREVHGVCLAETLSKKV